jgi:hypothetical protein
MYRNMVDQAAKKFDGSEFLQKYSTKFCQLKDIWMS